MPKPSKPLWLFDGAIVSMTLRRVFGACIADLRDHRGHRQGFALGRQHGLRRDLTRRPACFDGTAGRSSDNRPAHQVSTQAARPSRPI